MADIATIWSPADSRGDYAMAGPSLAAGPDIETAALISLFTDRKADPDDVIPDGAGDPRGWWADDPDRPIGSKLWLRYRLKQTAETLALVRNDIVEALQWIIDDGAAVRIDVDAQWARPGFLSAVVTFWRQDGSAVSLSYPLAWKGIG